MIDLSYWYGHQSDVLTYTGEHLRLTLITIAISLAIAIPIGTIVARVPILYTPVLGTFGVIYTIPSYALLTVLEDYVGIGPTNAVIALVAYAQFILIRNVVAGLRGVDASVKDAARGMGMSAWQVLLKIEFPLALPVILAGLRIATVATIAITSIAYLIDAGGLGKLLFDGISAGYNSEIEVGAIAISVLAVSADILFRIVDRFLPATRARAGR